MFFIFQNKQWRLDKIFLTSIKNIEKPIEIEGEKLKPKKFETIKVPEEIGKKLLKNGGFVKKAWQCPSCMEIYTSDNYSQEPPFCQNPNCDRKNLTALHPEKHHEIGNTLLNNYVFRTMRESQQVYMHNGHGIFENKGTEAKIKEMTKQMIDECKSHLQDEVVNHIRTKTGRPKEKFGLPKEKITVENGILNLEKLELEEKNLSKQIPLSKIPVKYDPDAECPQILEFINDIFKKEDIPVIQEFTGYCLWKSYDYAKVLVLLGDGENGKSTFLNLITRFLGQENISSTSLYGLLTNIKRRVNLYGKLANIAAETPDAIKNTDAFKKITGDDLLEARKLYKQTFKFYNHAKLIFAANELPELEEHTHAMFRRMILVDCPYKFTTNPKDSHKNADPEILEKITKEEEMSGFLNWALDGLKRLLDNNRFSETKTRKEVEERWIRETDPERAFIDKYIDVDYDTSIVRSELYDAYCDYCEENSLEAGEQASLTKKVNRVVPSAKKWKPKVGDKQKKSFKNICLEKPYSNYNREVSKQGNITRSTGKNSKNKLENTKKISDKEFSSNTRDNRDIGQDELVSEIVEVVNSGDFDKGELVDFLVENNDYDRDRVESYVGELLDGGSLIEGLGGGLSVA